MDELEPWNMFTTDDGNPDDAVGEEYGGGDMAEDGGANEHNGESEDNEPFAIPSPVQDMQVKEEPQDPELIPQEDDIYDDPSGFGFHSILGGGRDITEDDSLFDFNTENSNSSRPSTTTSKPTQLSELPPLSAEDEYFNRLVKYEDAIAYICPSCGMDFRSQESWKSHMNTVHMFNSRRGLNFIQLDKLYHECLECHKKIAMHSMENLLKHKFTHLPYRCCKCFICKRQYKYRQDLMVHLKLAHRDELIAIAKEEHKNRPTTKSAQNPTIRSILNKPSGMNASPTSRANVSIGQIKDSATDLFENDNIEVRNEVIEDEDDGDNSLPGMPPAKRIAKDLPSFADDGSTNGSAQDQRLSSNGRILDDIDESLEEYILFLCPQCGSECDTIDQWRKHIEFSHDLASRNGLNMKDINQGQAQCNECSQTITGNTIRNLQLHKFTHLSHSKWMNCKLCFNPFDATKEIIKHLADKHHLTPENNLDNDDDSQDPMGFGGEDFDDDLDLGDTKKSLRWDRDPYEKHIDYICPQCGKEFGDKKLWRKHLVDMHQFGDLEKLNFEYISSRQFKCKECDKIITGAYGIQNAQQHRISHMQFKSFAKCRICRKKYTDRKGLTKHLRTAHGMGTNSSMGGAASPIPNFGGSSTKLSNPYALKTNANAQKREIVRHNHFTYEICYLDEDDENQVYESSSAASRPVSSSGTSTYDFAKGDAHLYRRPPYQAPSRPGFEPIMSRHRCVDCGSSFPSHQSLLNHIQSEHEFVNNSYQKTSKNDMSNNEEQSNDADDLLVPSNRKIEIIRPLEPTTTECNFIYICPQCGVEFRLRHLWRRHINAEHNFDKRESLDFRILDKFRFQCKTCHEVVQSSKLKGLQDHKFRHCPFRQYLKCLICGQAYNHKPNMISHLRQRHNIVDAEPNQPHANMIIDGNSRGSQSSFQKAGPSTATPKSSLDCNPANANPSRPPGLKTVEDVISYHNAVDHESITYHCPSCAETFESHVYWRKHIVDEHNLNSREGLNFRQLDDHHYICLQCYKRVTVTHTKGAIGQLQSHKFRHLPYKSFRCTACKGEFVRKQMFFKHLDKVTNKCNGMYADNNFDRTEQEEDPSFKTTDSGNSTLPEKDKSAQSSTKAIWPTRASLPAQPTISESISENQGCYTLSCPQCGIEYDSTRAWREHINIEHNLNSRSVLNFKKINSKLHLCLECNEHVNGRKLRDLQVHKFKHLPYGAYLHCRYCTMNYFHISNMQEHLKNKHPQMIQKLKFDKYEDDTATFDVEEEEDANNFAGGDYDENMTSASRDVGDDAEADEDGSPCLDNVVDIDLLEAEAEIEEVDPDNIESDDQYLLG
ncbi:uncharacterized protein LOC142220777 [Haematobia irritans]|uniref:uncharacterized protein LOC142220777 n=1 Tax=Haematobia irritans TaxID=7368 RepID=UPI003F50494B